MSLRCALTLFLLAFWAIACGSATPPLQRASAPMAVQIQQEPAAPTAVPTASAPLALAAVPLPAPSAPPPPPLLPPAPVMPSCHWLAPAGGVLTLQGGTTYQFSLASAVCVDFTGRVEWDRPFADQYAHPLRTVSGSFRVDRYVVAGGVVSWILPDFGYVRG